MKLEKKNTHTCEMQRPQLDVDLIHGALTGGAEWISGAVADGTWRRDADPITALAVAVYVSSSSLGIC